jgi:hypothetical protein
LAANSAFHAASVTSGTPFTTRLLPILLLMITYPFQARE